MKNKKIGNVLLNYEFNKTDDVYSDGEVENRLLRIVKENDCFDDILFSTDEFPIFYHLSDMRKFIIQPMDISKNNTVLEIGAGCGAVTGALADKAKKVKCIELSERRSLINAYRNKEHDNVEILIGNYQDIKIEEKFDVITLVGVFEYAKYYFHTNNPYEDFLMDLKRKIKKDGRIYIAIENKLGAKYFAGCFEDHSNKMFDGIEGYGRGGHAKTFSYYEWVELLKKCDFTKYRFMYPYPDYKFPTVIYSQEFLPQKYDSFEKASNYSTKRQALFDEEKFLKNLNIENEFRIFSNSFLIEITC